MKNFDYLKDIPELSTLYTFCNAAEMTQQTDYDNCAANCRKALEWMVRAVYKLKNKAIEERATLFDLITGAPYADLIKDDRPLSMATHYIRKIGNVAVHQGGTTRKEAYFALLNTYNLIGGILLKFGVLNALAPFDKELIPKKSAPFVAPQPEVPEPTSEFVQAVPSENVTKPIEVTVEVDDFTEAERVASSSTLCCVKQVGRCSTRKMPPFHARLASRSKSKVCPTARAWAIATMSSMARMASLWPLWRPSVPAWTKQKASIRPSCTPIVLKSSTAFALSSITRMGSPQRLSTASAILLVPSSASTHWKTLNGS